MLVRHAKDIYSERGATVIGNPDGDVTVVEFIDYRCGYCKKLASTLDELRKSDPNVRVLVKHFPILGPESFEAASLMIAANSIPDKAELHHALISAQELDSAALLRLEQQFSVPTSDRAAGMPALGEVRVLAEQLGIQGTPAIVIGNSIFFGAIGIEQLEMSIKAVRSQQAMKSVQGKLKSTKGEI
jgi:protein-disulfide isomerase